MTTILRTSAVLAAGVLLAACHKEQEGPTHHDGRLHEEDVAAMYAPYIRGDYDKYVAQMESLDDKPDSYRQEMAMLMKQRHRQQEDDHSGGPLSCRVTKLEFTPDSSYCSAFILVTYMDTTEEEILLPLVHKDGQWRLR